MIENPTPQQGEIFQFIELEEGNLIVDAGPGCGKTATSVMAGDFVPSNQRTAFLAFNKSIADSLKSKLPENVHASTFNSLGFQIMRDYHSARTDPRKIGTILKEKFGMDPRTSEFHSILKMISSLRSTFPDRAGDPSIADYLEICNLYDIQLLPEDVEKGKNAAELSLKNPNTVDFDEQILFPVMKGLCPMDDIDTLFVDEVQDLSPLQQRFIQTLLGDKGRTILVGDPHQAIYGFRGADPLGMTRMAQMFHCSSLPLAVSFRCSKKVVELARNYNPLLEAAEGNIEGVTSVGDLPYISSLQPDDMILCRANAPLFRLGKHFLRSGTPCRIWSSLLPSLEIFIKSFSKKQVGDFKKALKDWRDKEVQRLVDQNREQHIPGIEDKYETVLALIPEGATQVNAVIQNLRTLASSENGPVISTIHKAKGSEAKRVFLLEKNLPAAILEDMPDWEERQLENMDYVAITRAEEDFYRVPEDLWKEQI